MKLTQKVRATIDEHQMIVKSDSVLVALSGGPDSVALLHLLSRLRRSLRFDLLAVHIDHGLRPRMAAQEKKLCRELCESVKVKLKVVKGDIPTLAREQRRGIEETARNFRYATFERLAEEYGCNRIALGHHADDQVETILFRLFRGSGRLGLRGIPLCRDRIIRPLLECRRDELTVYLKRHQLRFSLDKSNRDIRFKRNYIRHRLLPMLRENLNPQIERAILNMADSLATEDEFLERQVARAAKQSLSVSPGGKFRLDLKRFRTYDLWLRRRLLRRCLSAVCPDKLNPDKETVERLDKLAAGVSGAVSLPGRIRGAIVCDELLIYGRAPRLSALLLEPGKRLSLDWPRRSFSSRVSVWRQKAPRKKPGAAKVVLDWDKLTLPLEVRPIRAGDRFVPLGMSGHKKVGDYLTDRKVPREFRDELSVVCDKKGIVWLVDYEIADRVKIDQHTGKVLTIECRITKPGDSTAV